MISAVLRATETGGRSATTRHIPPKLALAVGMPITPAPQGWRWSALTDLARLESGHTPSRKHPEYWDGNIPWISIGDARAHDGRRINATEETTNDLGIANSSARVLPENTVCLSRTASVGYVLVMGRPMATSQDFVNWVCSKQLDHDFLKYLLVAEDENLLRFASGSVHQTIYFPEVKAFHICHPPLAEQQRIVGLLDEAFAGIATAQANAEKNLQNARALFDSHLQSVFTQRGKGWVEKTLGDICVVDWGNTDLTKSSYVEGGKFLAVSAAGCDGRIGHKEHAKHTPVLSAIGAQCGRMFLPEEDFTAIKNTITLTPLAGTCAGKFLYRLLTHVDLPKRGAAQPFIAKGDILKFQIVVPEDSSAQLRIVDSLDTLEAETQRLASLYERKLAALQALKKSLLHQAFTGELTRLWREEKIVPFPIIIPEITTTDLHAGILAMAYCLHETHGKQEDFGHVKAEKIAHMVEAHTGIELGRSPMKDAAGPNDFRHLKGVEHRARMADYFSFQRVTGAAYRLKKGPKFDELVSRTEAALGNRRAEVDRLLETMVQMDWQQAEILATVYAAWNNLLLDGETITDERIVLEARERWHSEKLQIPRKRFFDAISWMRSESFAPSGRGKKVVDKVIAK